MRLPFCIRNVGFQEGWPLKRFMLNKHKIGYIFNLNSLPLCCRSRNYKLIDIDSQSSMEYFADDFRPLSINLMEDPDIQQAMKKSLSTEDIPDDRKENNDSDSSVSV